MEITPEIRNKKLYTFYCLFICISTIIFNFFLNKMFLKIERLDNINHFEYNYQLKNTKNNINSVNSFYNKYQQTGKNVMFLSSNTAWLRVINDEPLDCFSVLNMGNFGYDGKEKMINKVKKMKETYYIINYSEYRYAKEKIKFNYEFIQFDYRIIDYIIDNSTFVEKNDYLRVYYYE